MQRFSFETRKELETLAEFTRKRKTCLRFNVSSLDGCSPTTALSTLDGSDKKSERFLPILNDVSFETAFAFERN